jgi:hypothetical protein
MSQATPLRPLLRAWFQKYTETSLIARAVRAGWALLLRFARLDPPVGTAGGRGQQADSSQLTGPSPLAGPSSEPSRARALDLALLGQLLAARLARDDDGGTDQRGFARLWARRIVPLAIGEGCEWRLGMTAMIQGLTSPAGQVFNGKVGRISERLVGVTPGEWRWELLVEGPQGVGSVNVRPANLRAPSSVEAVLAVWRLVPNRSQESPAALGLADLHSAVADGELHKVGSTLSRSRSLSLGLSLSLVLSLSLSLSLSLRLRLRPRLRLRLSRSRSRSRSRSQPPTPTPNPSPNPKPNKVGALLLGGGVGLSACDAKGRTALHVALERLAQAAEEEAAEEEAAEAKGGAAEAEEAAEAAEAAADGAQGPPSVVPADAQAAQQAKLQAIVGSELQAMVGWLISNQP